MSLFKFLEAFHTPAIVTDESFMIMYLNQSASENKIYGHLLDRNVKLMPDIIQSVSEVSELKPAIKSMPFSLHTTTSNYGTSIHWEVSALNLNGEKYLLFVEQLNFGINTSDKYGKNIDKQPVNHIFDDNAQLDRLLKNIPGMVFRGRYNAERNMLIVSRGCKRLTGYTVKELTESNKYAFGNLIHENDRMPVWKSIQENLNHHSYYKIQYRIVTKNGKIKWVEEQSHALKDAQNKVEYLEGILTDINQIRLSEEALKFEVSLNQAFAGISLELLKGFVKIDQIADMVINHAMNFTGSAYAVLILPGSDGKHYQVFASGEKLSVQHPLSFEVPAETFEKGFFKSYLRLNSAIIDNNVDFHGELTGISDKHYHIRRGMAIPAIFENQMASILLLGNAEADYDHNHLAIAQRFLNVFTLGMFKLKADESLRYDKEKAEESDKMKSLFLSNMSHDLRTPMNAIVGFADMLRETNLNVEEKEKFIEAIIRSGDNLLRLVNDIIDISKIEAGELRLIISECNLNQMIDDIEMATRQALSRHHKLRVQFYSQKGVPGDTFMILTDVTRLQQILMNLTGNAVKFTDDGFIEVGYRIENTKLLFFVRDSGLGILPEDQKLIFERFGQARQLTDRNKTGTGLGLTISKNLVELMGGNLWLDSWPGEGSTFWFTLPLLKVQSKAQLFQPPQNSKQEVDLSGKTVLVVEDVDTNYFYLSSLLEKLKCRVLRASNGRKAVEMGINDLSIDMILMDIELPLKNGYEATREIKASRPDLPIVAQTAFAMIGERERSEAAGCDDYMAKPIRKDQLINMVLKYIK